MNYRLLLLALALLPAACSETATEPQAETEAQVYTTFYPTTYLAERIAGGAVPVVCPLPEGEDPIFWQPSREVLADYQGAALIVVNGAGLEKWVETASLPASRVVDTAAGFEAEFLHYETTTHSHGSGGEHTHEGLDGHTWMDPVLAMAQARAIGEALAARFPEHAEAFAAGGAALRADLERLDARFRELTPRLAGVRLLASHPAYDYAARRYGWEIRNFDLDPEAELDAESLAELQEAAEGRTVLLWESAPLEATERALAELGIASVVFSPCESLDRAELEAGVDYLAVMHANLGALEEAAGAR